MGVIPANESVSILKNYYALLFPTFWPGEGMPGAIIDAMLAGVPVIVRRWEFCDEMIKDGVNGYVYDQNKPELLKDKIMYAVEHKEQMAAMRKNCLAASKQYSEKNVIQMIMKELGIP